MKPIFVTSLYFILDLVNSLAFAAPVNKIIDMTHHQHLTVPSTSLNTSHHYLFTAQTPSQLVVKVSQKRSNVRLTLTQCQQGEFDAPASYRQPEIVTFVVMPNKPCQLTVSGVEEVDRQSRFSLSVEKTEQPQVFEVYQMLSRIGTEWHTAQSLPDSEYNGQLLRMVEYYQQAEDLANKSQRPDLTLYAQYQRTVAYHYLGQYQQQASLLEEMVKSTSKNNPWQVPVWLDLASFHLYENNAPAKARGLLNNILSSANIQKRPLYYADALEALASIEVREHSYARAIATFQQTYDLFLSNGALASALNSAVSLGYFYLKSGDLFKASSQYNAALVLATQLNDNYSITNANIKLATIYHNLGELDQADEFISTALASSAQFSHAFLDAWAHQEKARLLVSSAQYQLALDHFEQTREAFDKISAQDQVQQTNLTLASLYIKTGEFKRAQSLLDSFLLYARNSLTPFHVATTLAKMGQLQLELNQAKQALNLQQEALEIIRASNDQFELGTLYQHMALASAKLGQMSEAEAYFAQSQTRLQKLKARVKRVSALANYAKAIETYQPERSQLMLKQATEQMLSLHQTLKRKDIKRGFLASFQPIVSQRIQQDASLTDTESLLLAELVRAQGLQQQLMAKAQKQSHIHKEQQKNLQAINQTLAKHFVTLQQSENLHQTQSIMQNLRALSEQRYRLEKDYYQHTVTDSLNTHFDHKKLNALQHLLPSNTQILFLDIAANGSHAWDITPHNVSYRSLPKEQALVRLQTPLLQGLINKVSLSSLAPQLSALSQQLIGPQGLAPETQHLIIITDGPLANFPFLLLKKPGKKGYLFHDVSTSQHHSLKALLHQLETSAGPTSFNSGLLVANPQMLEASHTRQSDSGFQAANLPFSEREANSLIRLLPDGTTILKQENANKKNLFNLARTPFDIVHFATHAIANSEFTELGGIVLSNAESHDNLLLTPEIKQLNFQASLVVLSGCETTNGRHIAGEGMLGLSRAFFESGASNVLGSLWKVQDDATALLMERFYTYLLTQKRSMADALVLAQNDVRHYRRKDGVRPWKAPFYWAGFVLHGMGS